MASKRQSVDAKYGCPSGLDSASTTIGGAGDDRAGERRAGKDGHGSEDVFVKERSSRVSTRVHPRMTGRRCSDLRQLQSEVTQGRGLDSRGDDQHGGPLFPGDAKADEQSVK